MLSPSFSAARRPGSATVPSRIRRSRARGWSKPPLAVDVTRSGPWGNPFRVGLDGNAAHCVHLYQMLLAGFVCFTCKASVEDQRRHLAFVRTNLADLRGKPLMCWCRIGAPCHADVLLELANA